MTNETIGQEPTPGTIRDALGLTIPELGPKEIILWAKALKLIDDSVTECEDFELALLEVTILCRVGYVLEIWNGTSWEPFCGDTLRAAFEANKSCCDHKSDCAQHNAPAEPVGACDCGVGGEPHTLKTIVVTDPKDFLDAAGLAFANRTREEVKGKATVVNLTTYNGPYDLVSGDYVQVGNIRYVYSPELA